jgi:Flp pilus assembly protein TadD
MQRGDLAGAEAKLREALSLRQDIPDFFGNLGLVLRMANRHDEAIAAYRQALAIDPSHAISHNNLGLSLQARGDAAGAVEHFSRAVDLQPQFAEAYANLASALRASGSPVKAEAIYRRALELRSQDYELWLGLGHVLRDLGRHEEAAGAYRRALALKPGSADAHVALGRLLNEQLRDYGPAEREFLTAAKLKPDSAAIQHHLGAVLRRDRSRLDEAEAAYRRALALEPNAARILNDLGSLLFEMRRFDDAEATLRQAIAAEPGFMVPLNSLGNLLKDLRRFDEAEACYRKALELDPTSAGVRWNLSLLLLACGRLAEGWPLHEARYDASHWQQIVKTPELPIPAWHGESLVGKSVMVLPEQGFGDNIQFVRYIEALKRRGAERVTVFTKPPLVELFQGIAGADAVVDVTLPPRIEDFDVWTLLLSIPLHEGTTLESIPARLPYLRVPSAASHRWSGRLPAGQPRVGLVWRGNTAHTNDADRSLPGLRILAPLWSVPGIRFFSLQKGAGEADAEHPPAGQPLVHLGGEIRDFADTAAIVSQLDLVITVDTAIAHLAGALGKPVWVLLPYIGTDWRWLLDRDDSPWYPHTMRLFRQPEVGQWEVVIARVAAALRAFLTNQAEQSSGE